MPYPIWVCARAFSQARAVCPCHLQASSHRVTHPCNARHTPFPVPPPPSAQSLDGSHRLLHLSVADHVRREGQGRGAAQGQGVAAQDRAAQDGKSRAAHLLSMRPDGQVMVEFSVRPNTP